MIFIRLIDQTGDAAICAVLERMAAAVEKQCSGEFATAWNLAPTKFGVGNAPLDGEWPAVIVPTLDDPGALAYHFDDRGYPSLVVGRDAILGNGGTILSGSNSISAALSHEVGEALVDPYCDWWSEWRDGSDLVALEAFDPVEDGSYEIDGVAVSNFVHPEWFRPGSSREKFDHLGVLTAPLTISAGGYVALRSGQQVFGEKMPEWKRAEKAKYGRRARRALRR